MPSTHLSLHYHIVFATKDRVPSIDPAWRAQLHEYLGGVIRGLGGVPESVGGVGDHVHALTGFKATHCLADFVREVKKATTAWVHREIGLSTFAWQDGYSAFTVSSTAREAVKNYIANQETHHRTTQSLDELKVLLARAGVDYDARFLE